MADDHRRPAPAHLRRPVNTITQQVGYSSQHTFTQCLQTPVRVTVRQLPAPRRLKHNTRAEILKAGGLGVSGQFGFPAGDHLAGDPNWPPIVALGNGKAGTAMRR
ncbi:hypothetical protein GCM10009678_14560 [Actinomadura kijaniata]